MYFVYTRKDDTCSFKINNCLPYLFFSSLNRRHHMWYLAWYDSSSYRHIKYNRCGCKSIFFGHWKSFYCLFSTVKEAIKFTKGEFYWNLMTQNHLCKLILWLLASLFKWIKNKLKLMHQLEISQQPPYNQ